MTHVVTREVTEFDDIIQYCAYVP